MTVYRSAALTSSPPDYWGLGNDLILPIISEALITEIAANTQSGSPDDFDAEDENFPVENLLNPSTHLRWASLDTGEDIYLDATGFTDDVNHVAFAAHNFAGFTITIYGQTSGSPADLFQIFEPTLIDSNVPILFQFVQSDYTRIRVKISGSGVRTAAVMYCGLLLTMPRGVKYTSEHNAIQQAQKTDVLSGYSESGNFLGRLIRNQIFETKYEFSNIKNEDFGSDQGVPIWAFLRFTAPQQPFFINWLPNESGEALGFVWLIADPMPTQNPVTRRWSVTLQVRGYASGV